MLERMFNYENPVWQFMNRVADLLILNVLALIFSLPVITIGASWTAMYYCTLKIVRKEDTYVWKEFWKSFKENFKQATLTWLVLIPFIAFLSLDVFMWIGDPSLLPKPLKVTTIIVILIILAEISYVFPILSHFDNTFKNTLKNAFILSIINLPYTVLFIILNFGPIIAVMIDVRLMMVYAMFGFSLPALLASYGWNRIFRKLEPKKEEEEIVDDAEWTVDPVEEIAENIVETQDENTETEQ